MVYFTIFLFILLFTIALASWSLAPWVPTKKNDLKRILELADLKAGEIFYDLGSGDGKVAVYLANRSQAKVIGLEIAIPFYLISKLRQLINYNKPLTFKFKNIYSEDLSGADVVYVFAESPEKLARRLKTKLESELKRGARVITYAFPMQSWEPAAVSKPHNNDISIYLYMM